MAQVTIYKEPGIVVAVIDGDPPADQSAEVAALTAERDAAIAQRDEAIAALAALNAAIDAAQGHA